MALRDKAGDDAKDDQVRQETMQLTTAAAPRRYNTAPEHESGERRRRRQSQQQRWDDNDDGKTHEATERRIWETRDGTTRIPRTYPQGE